MGEPELKEISIKFNPEKHFLGNLCNRGHEHENTGKSLRYVNGNSNCFMCAKEDTAKYFGTKKQYNKYHKNYYHQNLEKRRITNQKSGKKSIKKRVKDLADSYIKTGIKKQYKLTTVKNIPQEAIELKRAYLMLYRAILETKKLLKEKRKKEKQWR